MKYKQGKYNLIVLCSLYLYLIHNVDTQSQLDKHHNQQLSFYLLLRLVLFQMDKVLE